MSGEVWRDIPGFEGAYQVSNLGRVRSLDRMVRITRCAMTESFVSHIRGRILRPHHLRSGHYQVSLGIKNGKRVLAKIHALVLLAFVGPYPDGLEIRHVNGIPNDNRLANLEYATHSRNGLDVKWHDGNALYRLTPQDVLSIKRRLRDASVGVGVALAREYNVSASTISDIKCGYTHRDVVSDNEISDGGGL